MLLNLVEPNNADVFIYAGSDRLGKRAHVACSSLKTRNDGSASAERFLLDFDEKAYFRERLGPALKAFVHIEDEKADYVRAFREISPRCPYCLHLPEPELGCARPNPADPRLWFHVDAYLRMQRCDALRRAFEEANGFRYDVLVRCRGDIEIGFPIRFSEYACEPFDLHIESTHLPLQRDMFFFGGREVVGTLCSGFLTAYGRAPGSDLQQFGSYVQSLGARVRCLDSTERHFHAPPDYPRRRCPRTDRPCSCCIHGAGRMGIEIVVDYENTIAQAHGIEKLWAFRL